MNYSGIIFDLDGVLVCTDEFHYLAWKKIADELGIPFDRKVNEKLRGVSRMQSLEIILGASDKKFTELEKTELAEKKNNFYKSLLSSLTPQSLEEGVRETLVFLKSRNVKLALGSSSKNARYILDKTGITDLFDGISDGNNIKNSKPDPEVFLKAAEFIGLTPAQCLVVEDAEAGIDAACAGGFDSAGIGAAAGYDKCTYSLKTFSDIKNLI